MDQQQQQQQQQQWLAAQQAQARAHAHAQQLQQAQQHHQLQHAQHAHQQQQWQQAQLGQYQGQPISSWHGQYPHHAPGSAMHPSQVAGSSRNPQAQDYYYGSQTQPLHGAHMGHQTPHSYASYPLTTHQASGQIQGQPQPDRYQEGWQSVDRRLKSQAVFRIHAETIIEENKYAIFNCDVTVLGRKVLRFNTKSSSANNGSFVTNMVPARGSEFSDKEDLNLQFEWPAWMLGDTQPRAFPQISSTHTDGWVTLANFVKVRVWDQRLCFQVDQPGVSHMWYGRYHNEILEFTWIDRNRDRKVGSFQMTSAGYLLEYLTGIQLDARGYQMGTFMCYLFLALFRPWAWHDVPETTNDNYYRSKYLLYSNYNVLLVPSLPANLAAYLPF